MNFEEAKNEIKKHYKYIYENIEFILAPFMVEITNGEFKNHSFIYLRLTDEHDKMFADFLFSSNKMEETEFYKMIESSRDDIEYLQKVKNGLLLVEKQNEMYEHDILKLTLSIDKILNSVIEYIQDDTIDTKSEDNKLRILNEYNRIARYNNDGPFINFKNRLAIFEDKSNVSFSTLFGNQLQEKNEFIDVLIDYLDNGNYSVLSEEEGLDLYLSYNDELPWNLEIICGIEEKYKEDVLDNRLKRPSLTNCCGYPFYVKEEEIFVDEKDEIYRYYQLCPHCGYIVNIPKEILSDGIRKRIDNRCKKDEYLFREKVLYSELMAINNRRIKKRTI